MDQELTAHLKSLIDQDQIVLFMKGDKYMPQCGFSAQVVDILNDLELNFSSFDILEDERVRQGLKEYSNWPTYPQLYYKGELIGGCDIIKEMYENEELKSVLTQ